MKTCPVNLEIKLGILTREILEKVMSDSEKRCGIIDDALNKFEYYDVDTIEKGFHMYSKKFAIENNMVLPPIMSGTTNLKEPL